MVLNAQSPIKKAVVTGLILLTQTLWADTVPQTEVFVSPATITPSTDRIIRFAIGVKNIPKPGLSSFALDIQFSGPVNLIPSIQEQPNNPVPNNKITCSTDLKTSAPAELIVPNTLIQLQSGLGDFMLQGVGKGNLLVLKNETNGDTARYAVGLGGDDATVKPQTGDGAIVEFRCLAGTQVPKNAQVGVKPKLIPETTGALFLFGQGNPEQSILTEGVITQGANLNSPVAVDDVINIRVNETTNIAVTDNDTDVEDGIPTGLIQIKTSPAHGSVTVNGRLVNYVPNTGFIGADSFTYSVQDSHGLASNEATVRINVGTLNTAPVAQDDNVNTKEDKAISIPVLANDTDVDRDTLVLTASAQATNGTVTIDANAIKYTPNKNYNGTDTFTYQISDGRGGAATGAVTVTVDAVNDAPIANNDTAETGEESPVTVTVLANDSDVDGDNLTIKSVSQGLHGKVTMSGNNVIYTPDKDYNGTDSFTYQISDGVGKVVEASVSVTITPVNDAPVALIQANKYVAIKQPIKLDSSASHDPDKDLISFSWSLTKPVGSLAQLNNTKAIQPTITPDIAGTYVLKLTVADNQGAQSEASFSVNAQDPLLQNIPPNAEIVTPAKTVLVNQAIEFDGTASNDPDKAPNSNSSFHWDLINRPKTSTSVLTTPESETTSLVPDVEGNYRVRLTVDDGALKSSAEQTLSAVLGNVPPVADAGQDQQVPNGNPVLLTAAASSDDNDAFTALTFLWRVVKTPKGSTINNTVLANQNSVDLKLNLDIPGDYLLRLDVSDPDDASGFDQVLVTVTERPQLENDLDNDGDIDSEDVERYKANPTDIDKNSVVNILDFKALVLSCTRPKCAT